ncbi:GntR family transcriptional regulator [Branchiibius hedensis]|uniref:GntR family transcriptional regulator n=1 Tax=Branchiibius hedensis TaxID=672460 RepID=A0A2Y8ZQQ4_9MICO|nr:GntR family transcriptional regulator [Branchiibius hedensis]PWJ24910.1 GntR family transcriptional regulator [Branchiibius hedensis]SSA33726.1 GntR family transcriptional regulator [Branchiibius hedensis]
MLITLDPTSDVPMYVQIRDQIIVAIARRRLRAGEALASVRQLSASFGISPATVVKAYDDLRADGYLRTAAKSGSVIAVDPETPADIDDPAIELRWRADLETVIARAYARGMPADRIRRIVAEVLADLERN